MRPYLPSLNDLQFDNRFVEQLPADPIQENYSRQVFDAAYSWVKAEKAPRPALLAYSKEMLNELELKEEVVHEELFSEVFVGNQLLPGMQSYASNYGGHQFGNWAGQLGDGRALNLGDVITSTGKRWALQLKGAGPTPYSRRGDGFAVLRSSIREFLCSESMYHLGVPTTRALSLIRTGNDVLRDMFYDGNAGFEAGAVVCRVAPSFTRLGHFQLYAAREENDLLNQFVRYTLDTDYPELKGDLETKTIAMFHALCQRTATMIMHWMTLGFVHGVMNTDNFSILGLTIDYGPYGWLEDFDPLWTPNTTDAHGRRYCFGNQPQIAHWNLAQFAQSLTDIVQDIEALKEGLNLYVKQFTELWETRMAIKLGIGTFQESDRELITECLDLLQNKETDMTIFHRNLAQLDLLNWNIPENLKLDHLPSALRDAYYAPDELDEDYFKQLHAWLTKLQKRSQTSGLNAAERLTQMNRVNPKFVLRNYLVQEAIDEAESGNYQRIDKLLEVMRQPFAEQAQHAEFAQKRPEWARHKAGCSMLSCSS